MERDTRWFHALGAIALGSFAAACGPTVVPARTALPEDEAGAALRGLLEKGQHVVLHESATCDAMVADDFKLLVEGAGPRLGAMSWGKAPGLWTVQASVVALEDEAHPNGFLAVKLADERAAHWVAIPTGKPLACLSGVTDEIVVASRMAGKHVVLTPGKTDCARLEARGTAATSTFLDGDPGTVLDVVGLVAVEGDRPWIGLQRDTLRVPFDVVRACFTEVGPAGTTATTTKPPAGATLLHTRLERCQRDDDGGKEHLECHTTLGVWEGAAGPDALTLQLVRRTLGPVHFTGGQPVDGRRYAHTVIAVSMGRPRDERARDLYAAIEAAVRATLAEGDGSVRVAKGSDPKVTYRIKADTDDLRVGDLVRREEQHTSQYQDGERDVPNPRYPEAQAAVGAAAGAVDQAKVNYQNAMAQYAKDKQLAEVAAEQAKHACDNITNPVARMACGTGSGAVIRNIPTMPTTAGIDAAQNALNEANNRLASTPPTVKEPILKTWTYPKIHYARSVSTTLHVVLDPRGGQEHRVNVPLSQGWEDYEIAADARHNVTGHEPDRAPIHRPEAIVPWLARKAAAEVTKHLRAALDQAVIDGSVKALVGGEPPRPGFEAVDATAYEIAGKRLARPLQRGTAHVGPEGPAPIPSEGSGIPKGQCLLAVAVGHAGADLRMTSEDGAFADARAKRVASVEVCASELPNGRDAVKLHLTSGGAGEAKWGLYRTLEQPVAGETAAAPTAPKQ